MLERGPVAPLLREYEHLGVLGRVAVDRAEPAAEPSCPSVLDPERRADAQALAPADVPDRPCPETRCEPHGESHLGPLPVRSDLRRPLVARGVSSERADVVDAVAKMLVVEARGEPVGVDSGRQRLPSLGAARPQLDLAAGDARRRVDRPHCQTGGVRRVGRLDRQLRRRVV